MPEPSPRQVHLYPSSLSGTVLFLTVFLLAFFPPLFNAIAGLPLQGLGLIGNAILNRSLRVPATVVSKSSCAFPQPSAVPDNPAAMSWFQKTISLPSKSRGSYLITDHIVQALPEIRQYRVGILHLFVQHTSCALSMNENWDSEVREDMSDALDRIVPEDKKGNLYRHSAEGPDDMPAHVKSALIGSSVTIPITDGKLATGTWQGIWYLEFRTSKHSRKAVATIQGEKS